MVKYVYEFSFSSTWLVVSWQARKEGRVVWKHMFMRASRQAGC